MRSTKDSDSSPQLGVKSKREKLKRPERELYVPKHRRQKFPDKKLGDLGTQVNRTNVEQNKRMSQKVHSKDNGLSGSYSDCIHLTEHNKDLKTESTVEDQHIVPESNSVIAEQFVISTYVPENFNSVCQKNSLTDSTLVTVFKNTIIQDEVSRKKCEHSENHKEMEEKKCLEAKHESFVSQYCNTNLDNCLNSAPENDGSYRICVDALIESFASNRGQNIDQTRCAISPEKHILDNDCDTMQTTHCQIESSDDFKQSECKSKESVCRRSADIECKIAKMANDLSRTILHESLDFCLQYLKVSDPILGELSCVENEDTSILKNKTNSDKTECDELIQEQQAEGRKIEDSDKIDKNSRIILHENKGILTVSGSGNSEVVENLDTSTKATVKPELVKDTRKKMGSNKAKKGLAEKVANDKKMKQKATVENVPARSKMSANKNESTVTKTTENTKIISSNKTVTEIHSLTNPDLINAEVDDWEAQWDDSGECLDPTALKELSKLTGIVKPVVRESKIDYYTLPEQDVEIAEADYGHILEVNGFAKELRTSDICMALASVGVKDFNLQWVDDTHALAVFSSVMAAQSCLNIVSPVLKVCSIGEASKASKLKAKLFRDTLLPYKKRPETTAFVARNMVASALGIRSRVGQEQRAEERRKLKEAKEKKKQKDREKAEIWGD